RKRTRSRPEGFPLVQGLHGAQQRRSSLTQRKTARKEAGMKLLDRMRESLAKVLRVPEGQAPPVAIVWTDATGEWLSLAPMMRELMPEFFTLGTFRPKERTGPAIWLKCIVDRTIPEAPPAGVVPILYLPHVSRQVLRAAADCPAHLTSLIELQYR